MKLSNILTGSIMTTLFSSALLASGGTYWGYTGHEGPSNWGDLSSDYTICKEGKSQSPINIDNNVTVEVEDLEIIDFNYNTGISSVINDGHTIQVNFDTGSSVTVDAITFPLIQLHFHTPSENQIDGKNFPLEGHFVHATQDGSLAVIALMFEDGAENPFIKKVWEKMPRKAGGKNHINISAYEVNTLLPIQKDYYRFNGSLTTPPCTEGVRWLVLKNFTTISKEQTQEFLELFHHANNRPIQPINARNVLK